MRLGNLRLVRRFAGRLNKCQVFPSKVKTMKNRKRFGQGLAGKCWRRRLGRSRIVGGMGKTDARVRREGLQKSCVKCLKIG